MAYSYFDPNPIGGSAEKAPNDAMRMEFQEFIDRMERMKK